MKTLSQIRENLFSYNEQYGNSSTVLSEELHSELQNSLDSNLAAKNKLTDFTRTARNLIKQGQSTGLENDKPLKGSSRAVFLSKENKPIHIDGEKTSIPTATKIAFAGKLDRYTNHHQLLGEMQNEREADRFANHYSVLRHTEREGHYEHNPNGVLAPVLSKHPEHHYIEFGKIEKPTSALIKEATKTPEFPKGITHEQIYDAVNHSYNEANNIEHYSGKSSLDNGRDKIKDHPFVDTLTNYTLDTGMHPADLRKQNMGIWEHPINKTKHLVVSDYGFGSDVAKHYQKARKNMRIAHGGY